MARLEPCGCRVEQPFADSPLEVWESCVDGRFDVVDPAKPWRSLFTSESSDEATQFVKERMEQ